jgi:hypothetical protein
VNKPQADDESIEDIEAVADILKETESCQLQHHLNSKYGREDKVADLDHAGESLGLVVVLDAHAEGVDEDAEEDALLEDIVVHGGGEAGATLGEAVGDAGQAGGQAPGAGHGGGQCGWREDLI